MTVLVALDDPKDALFGQHLRAIGAGDRLALIGRHLVDALWRLGAPGAQRADIVRYAPDAILIGHQHIAVPPGEPVGPVEVLDMPIDPLGAPLAIVAQQ